MVASDELMAQAEYNTLNLSKKIALVISIPIVCQTVVISLLLGVHAQSARAVSELKSVDAVLECLNQVNEDVDELIVLVVVKRPVFTNISDVSALTKLSKRLDVHVAQLEQASAGDDAILATLKKAQAIKQEMLRILVRSMKARSERDFENGVNLPKIQLNALTGRLTEELLPEVRAHEQRLAARSASVNNLLRVREEQVALLGGCLTVILSGIAGALLSRLLTRRIERLQDNTFRLASRLELNSPDSGSDELAVLDQSFQRLARTLKEKERRETLFIDGAADGIVALDNSHRITFSNNSFIDLTGYSFNELKDKTIFSFLAESAHSKLSQNLDHAQKQDIKGTLDAELIAKDGHISDTIISVKWLPTEGVYYCTIRDVSNQRAAERRKSDIVEMVSHDLKTPLCTVDNVLTMLNEPCSEEKKQRYLGSAQRNVKRSIQLVLDFLDIEKLESNAFAFTATNFPLSRLWSSLEDAVLGIAHKRQISLILPDGDEWIFADQDSILRVLINLVSNAIEHGQPNTAVKIRTSNLKTHWEISVEDEGPGIEQKDMQMLFDRFYRTKPKAGSTGLGLTISKHLIEQQGGKIDVRSKTDHNQGTVFSFTVPVGVRGESSRPGTANS